MRGGAASSARGFAPAIALALVAGCASGPQAPDGGAASSDLPFELRPGGPTSTLEVRAGVLPLGRVPYDNLTLPILSPDGRLIATETGIDPTWETVLAEPAASVPQATAVEIYELVPGTAAPRHVAMVGEPVLLGRSSSAGGFLVEAPRGDGSRWIGHVDWSSGAVTWLVADDHVNAFASLGPQGQLAWSRRAIDDDHFDLVVRRGDGQEWSVGSADEDWLVPQWTAGGDTLFVLHLREGRLQALYGSGVSDTAFRQSLRVLALAEGASLFTAFQVMNGQVTISGTQQRRPEELVFRDPVSGRVALWQPLAAGSAAKRLLRPGSSFAVIDDADCALVTTDESLVRQSVLEPRYEIDLLAGTLIARPTTSPDWPYILLAPTEKHIGITAMRLLPLEEE